MVAQVDEECEEQGLDEMENYNFTLITEDIRNMGLGKEVSLNIA